MPKIKSQEALKKYRENLARIKHLKQQSLGYKDKASKLSKVSNSLSKTIKEAILESDRNLCSMHYMKKREKAIKPPGRPKVKPVRQTIIDLNSALDIEHSEQYKQGELGHHSKQLLDECFTPTSNKQLFSPSDYKRIITEDEDEYEEPVFIKPSRKTKYYNYTSEELNEIFYEDGTSRLSAEEKFPNRYPKRYFKTGKTQKPNKSNPIFVLMTVR